MSRYNLRNSDQLQTIDSRTNLYYNSSLPSTVRAWNSLPAEVKQSQTTHSFKYYFNKDKTSVPKYYYSKNRKAQILHTRLRTNCSSLNLGLFLKGITDSPMCRCGSIENSQHFFFHCPYYQQQRNALQNVVSTFKMLFLPIIDLLLIFFLYGESSLSYDVNMIIFENIHRFILNCKRFSWDVLNTAMVMRLLYYIYPLQTVLYSILDAGCPDPSIPISHLSPSHLPLPPPPHRPLVLSIYIFLTFANLKMLYMKWILFGVKLYIRFSSFLSPKHVKPTLIVNYHYIMLLAPMYLPRNSPLCILVGCFWEKNYISTCAFVLIPICIMTCIML